MTSTRLHHIYLVAAVLLAGCATAQATADPPTNTPSPEAANTVPPPSEPASATPVPANTPTPGPPSEIVGTIVNAAGEPIVDAPVRLYINNTNDLVRETKTDENGQYTLANVPPGTYRIKYDLVVSLSYVLHNYTPAFEVEGGTTVTQDITYQN